MRQTDKQIEGQTDTWERGQSNRKSERTIIMREGETYRQRDRRIDRQKDRQTKG